jgi:hypothetical protein
MLQAGITREEQSGQAFYRKGLIKPYQPREMGGV